MKKLLFLVLASAAASAFADVAEPYNGPGAYINLNAGYGSLQSLPSGSFGLGANAGYNFNRGFAIEGGYTNLTSNQYGGTAYDNFFDAAVKGTIPLSSVFSLYGRLGAGINNTSSSGTVTSGPCPCVLCTSSTNLAGLAGVGGSFALSRHFDLRIEDYVILPVSGGYGNVNVATGGLQYNF